MRHRPVTLAVALTAVLGTEAVPSRRTSNDPSRENCIDAATASSLHHAKDFQSATFSFTRLATRIASVPRLRGSRSNTWPCRAGRARVGHLRHADANISVRHREGPMAKHRMFRVLAVLVTAMATTGALAVSAAGQAAATATTVVKIEQYPNCLENLNGTLALAGCQQGAGNQKWTEVPATYGLTKFENSGYCLDDTYTFIPCSQGDANQRFSINSATGGLWKIEHYSICLDSGSSTAFSTCQQGNGNQRWSLPSSP